MGFKGSMHCFDSLVVIIRGLFVFDWACVYFNSHSCDSDGKEFSRNEKYFNYSLAL